MPAPSLPCLPGALLNQPRGASPPWRRPTHHNPKGVLVLTPHATPKVQIATTDLRRLHDQIATQQDQLARAAALIAELWPRQQRLL